jgi:hypothetical protein
MTCRVRLEWGGRVWDLDGELVEIADDASILEQSLTVPSRSVTVELPLGDVVKHARTHHPRTAVADVYHNGRLVASEAVESITPGRAGELSRIVVGQQVDPDASTIPATYDVETRQIDIEGTERARQRAENQRQRQVEFYQQQNIPVPWDLIVGGDWDGDSITVYSEETFGLAYPRVYGRPGQDGTAGSKALVVDSTNRILRVAGHRCAPGTVTIVGPKQSNLDVTVEEAATVYNTTDSAGRPVADIDVSGLSTVAHNWTGSGNLAAQDKDWYVKWNGTARGLSSDATSVITDLLRHLVGVPIDWPSIESMRAYLQGYTLDGVIDATTGAEAVLMQQILPLLPVRLVRGVTGLGMVPVRWTATARDARCALVAGDQCWPVSRVRYASEAGLRVINQWSVRWAMSRRSDGPRRTTSVGPSRSGEASASLTIHGLRAETLETAWVYTAATAGRIALDRIRETATDRQIVDVQVSAATYGIGGVRELTVGDVVTYTDPAESLSAAVALVSSVSRSGSEVDGVGLVLL